MRRSRIYFALGILALLSFGISVSRPYSFQKLNTLVPADGFEPLSLPARPVDIAGMIENAPVLVGSAMAVDPARKYRMTIEEGIGNCSERAFGLAWRLLRSDVDFQIVHLLSKRNFIRGGGHSVIRIPYEYEGAVRVGLVDLLEGGLPTSAGEPIDVEDLVHGSIPEFAIRPLSRLQDDQSAYYDEFLETISVGYIPAREVDRYFRFIKLVYIPLGNDRLEKYLYDGLALIFGVLPKVHVQNFEDLVSEHRAEMRLQKTVLWTQRILILVFPVVLIFEACMLCLRRRGASIRKSRGL